MFHDFIELHARSAFSFLRGTDYPAALIERAAELGMGALALCDRSGFQGAPRFYAAAREAGLHAIVGTELPMEDGSALPVLVESRVGYQNLCRLLTRAKLRSAKGEEQVGWGELAEFGEGMHCLTGDCEGPIQQHLQCGDLLTAEKTTRKLVEIFGKGHVHVELQRYRVRGEGRIVQCLRDLAAHLGLPVIASNAPLAARAGNRPLMDSFTCLRHHVNLDHAGRLLDPNAERHLKSPRAMAELFADIPEAIRNAARLADRLDFTLDDLGYEFPQFPTGDGETEDSILRNQTYCGARDRYGSRLTSKVRRQLEHELDLIARLGFSGYFLIVWDIVRFTKERGMLAQGRGSAANSAVCYSLGITNVDPVGGELLFERFLSEGREGWPDIDIDLPSGDQRESVIQEVYRRYGRRGAAMTANVITYRSRSAMREMGKVLDLPSDVLGRFSDSFGREGFSESEALRERLRMAGLPSDHPRGPALITLLQAVRGLPRHLGQHSGGMIISDRGLDSIVPLENASMDGRSIVQWDKDDCEDLGIIKVDLLGLGMMAALEETVKICGARGRPVDLAQLPQDDPETYAMLQRADTIGLFQVESRAQQACLPRMKPKVFYDVVIQTALIRPGPIVGNLVHPYLNRRRGTEPITYIDERFEPALKRTLGIPLFQEQVLRMAMVIADFTGSEAEELRRALSFNRSQEKMDLVMEKLRAAMTRKGISEEKQQKIIDSIRSFALYGFPESHAISFALLAYASAWLKVHRTPEFYIGLLNNQPMGFYSPATLIEDARRWGIRVRPVCIVRSEERCTVLDDTTIRLGLKLVRGVSKATISSLLEARSNRPFTTLEELLLRVRIPRAERRILARTGVFASISEHRRDALWQVEAAPDEDDLFTWAASCRTQDSADKIPDASSGLVTALVVGERPVDYQMSEDPRSKDSRKPKPQLDLNTQFLDSESLNPSGEIRPSDKATETRVPPSRASTSPLAPMTPGERLEADYAALHLTTGPHPMSYIRNQLGPGVLRFADLAQGEDGHFLCLAGMVICRQRPSTAKGHMFISLEDETGISNVFVPAKTFERYRLIITQEPFLKIHGRLQDQEGVMSVYTLRVEALPFDRNLDVESHDFH